MLVSSRLGQTLAWSLAELGEFTEAEALARRVLRLSEAANHDYSITIDSRCLGIVRLLGGDIAGAVPTLERSLAMTRHAQYGAAITVDTVAFLARGYARLGRHAEALELVRTIEAEAAPWQSSAVLGLAEVQLECGNLGEARRVTEKVVATTRAIGEHGTLGRGLWLLGSIAARSDPRDLSGARTHYHAALSLATELGMRPLVAHCHHGLGTLDAAAGTADRLDLPRRRSLQ